MTRVSCTKNNNIGRAFDRGRWRPTAGNAHCSTWRTRENGRQSVFPIVHSYNRARARTSTGGALRSRGHELHIFHAESYLNLTFSTRQQQCCKQKEIGFVTSSVWNANIDIFTKKNAYIWETTRSELCAKNISTYILCSGPRRGRRVLYRGWDNCNHTNPRKKLKSTYLSWVDFL